MPREYVTGERQSTTHTRLRSPWRVGAPGTERRWARFTIGRATRSRGDFDAQVHHTFREPGETLERTGGKLQDIVTMTVWILEPRYSRRFTQIRQEFFPDGFPARALITVRGFALPEMMVEIQATAIVGD